MGARDVGVTGSETGTTSATLGQTLAGSFTNPDVRNRWLKYGLIVLAAASAVTLLLLVLELFELGAIVNAFLKGLNSSSSTPPAQGSSPTASAIAGGMHVLAAMWSFVFFTSHLAPYELSLTGGLTIVVTGLGSFTVALITGFLSFAFGRRLERQAPPENSNGPAALRAALIGLPILVGSLGLAIAGSAHIDLGFFALDFHPSLVGVLIPTLLVSGSAALGALSVRPTRAGLGQPNAVRRGISRGVFAIASGIVIVIVLAILVAGYAQLTRGSGSATPPISAGSRGGLDLSSAGFGLLALLPFYVTNLLGFGWSWAFNYSQLGRSTLEVLSLGPPAGALLGATFLRRTADRVEQAAFAMTFGLGSLLIAFGTSPSNGHDTLGTPTLVVFLEALLIGGVAALVGPHLASLPILGAIPRLGPIAWAESQFRRMAPEAEVTATTGGAASAAQIGEVPGQRSPLRITLKRRYIAVAGVIVLLVAAGFGMNAYLTGIYGPDNAVLDYYRAQAAGNADAMWAGADYSASAGSVAPTLSKEALKEMLLLDANRDIKNVRATGIRDPGSGKIAVTISFVRAGTEVTQNVLVDRDSSHAHYGLYPGWRLELPPTRLSVSQFKNAGAIKVDGVLVSMDATLGLVMVIPGVHRVHMDETSVTAADDQMVDTWSGSGAVSFKPTFRPGAAEAAAASLKKAFAGCVASTQIKPVNCPNSGFSLGDVQSNVRWTLVSDPTVDAKYFVGDDPDTIRASGEFRMKLSYDYMYKSLYYNYQSHEDYEDSGPYGAILKADSSGGFQVIRFGRYV